MIELVFVDTNGLVYAIDTAAGERHRAARRWTEALWKNQRGRVSVQVLQEFYATTTRKLCPGLSAAEAQTEVRSMLTWSPVEISAPILERAWLIESRYQLSWWNALIVASAQTIGCRILLTEDLQDGQEIDGLRIVSPFRMTPEAIA